MSTWSHKPLSLLGVITTGSTPSVSDPKFYGGDIPFITPAELDHVTTITTSSRTLTKAGADEARLLPRDSVMVCCIGATIGKVGMAGCLVATNQQINAIVFNTNLIWPRFGYYACRWLKPKLKSMAPATTLPIISKSKFETLEIPVPPLESQQRIAAILDQADALRAKRRHVLAQIDSLTQSLFLDLCGDPIKNSKGWPAVEVDSLCTLVRGSSPRPKADPKYYGGSIPRLMVADVTRDGWLVTPRIDSLTESGAKLSRPVPAGTVVMAVSGDVGVVSQLAVDACIHDGFVGFTKLREDRVKSKYLVVLLHFLKATHERRKAGAIFQNLTTTDIKGMMIPLPPISIQMQFLQQVAAVERLKSAHRASLAKLDELFASLQHSAFRGELSGPTENDPKGQLNLFNAGA